LDDFDSQKPVFESHVDLWCLVAMVTGVKYSSMKGLYMVSLRWYRGQLRKLEVEKCGVRKRWWYDVFGV
jgi:hypothetical protein